MPQGESSRGLPRNTNLLAHNLRSPTQGRSEIETQHKYLLLTTQLPITLTRRKPWTKTYIRTVDFSIENKNRNYIMELSAVAYGLVRKELDVCLISAPNITVHANPTFEGSCLCVQVSISIQSRRNSSQIYKINLFHTTCKAAINGSKAHLFLLTIENTPDVCP